MTLACTLFGIYCALTPVTGTAYVVDGDTIRIDQQSFRLAGVDAEEMTEPYGPGARQAMQNAIGHHPVTCKPTGETSYHRIVARCYVGELELNMLIIASGWALDCARYSGGRYRQYELPGARDHLIQKGYCR